MNGTLYVVATPIGHLGDISQRALETLAEVDLVVAEDTRHSKRLLSHFSINTTLISFHEHSSNQRVSQIMSQLSAGKNIALISDAGTPLISDPGYELVHHLRKEGVQAMPIPGACALIAALSVSGLATDQFSFLGFAPAKSVARRSLFQQFKNHPMTMVFYESCHRIVDSLNEMAETFGAERQAFVGREMTKRFEQYRYDNLAALSVLLTDGSIPLKGEFVVIVAAAPEFKPGLEEVSRLLSILLAELPASKAAKVAARYSGLSKKVCFELCQDLKSST